MISFEPMLSEDGSGVPHGHALLVLMVCALPLAFSLPSLSDPFGQTEEGVNATIWGLGARNLLEEGPEDALLGAKVAPYPGPGPREGIYAHHPPLPVWVSAVVQSITASESGPRIAALIATGTALLLLFRLLSIFFPEPIPLVAVAAVATCPYVLVYGRMLTTLTLATPLIIMGLEPLLRHALRNEPWEWPLLPVLVLLVLSSWDGVIAAAMLSICAFWLGMAHGGWGRLTGWARALIPGCVAAATLAGVAAWLVWANGGSEAMVWQFHYRASSNLPGSWEWVRKQLGFISSGLGWGTLMLLLSAIVWLPKLDGPLGLAPSLLMSAVPAVGMVFIFRQGADRHPFWAYNLILPAAFAISAALYGLRLTRPLGYTLALALIALQGVIGLRMAGEQLARERILNARGEMLRSFFRREAPSTIRFVSAYNFYPFVSWYVNRPTDVVPDIPTLKERLKTGAWPGSDPVVVDLEQTLKANCQPFPALIESPDRRWSLALASVVSKACGG